MGGWIASVPLSLSPTAGAVDESVIEGVCPVSVRVGGCKGLLGAARSVRETLGGIRCLKDI